MVIVAEGHVFWLDLEKVFRRRIYATRGHPERYYYIEPETNVPIYIDTEKFIIDDTMKQLIQRR